MMKQLKTPQNLILSSVLLLLAHIANAQALPTAGQKYQLSAFGGGSGVFTDLEAGHNLSITAGIDFECLSLHGFHSAAEIRGTYPFHSGTINGQKSALGGLRVDRRIAFAHPYVNFLVGRGELDYTNGGFTIGPLTYLSTTTTVYSPGVGVDLDVTHNWLFKVDYQYQSWSTPVVASGKIHPSVFTLGAVYRFDFNHKSKRNR